MGKREDGRDGRIGRWEGIRRWAGVLIAFLLP